MVCVLGSISAMGWSLGIMEATGMIIVVGLAVDYSAHLVHAYPTHTQRSAKTVQLQAGELLASLLRVT